MSEWKVIKQIEIDLGGKNFIEVTKKKSPEGANLIAISKGWKNEDGLKRYKANILFNKDILNKIIESLEGIE